MPQVASSESCNSKGTLPHLESRLTASASRALAKGSNNSKKKWGGGDKRGGGPCLSTEGTKTAHYSKSLLKKKKICAEKVDRILHKML